eukprot:TRINITY_DN1562_c0_g1_i1.p1 TRINITY_DN1562_c0_g1~~TRINITY_DN1562_c0_g1_i1.p1  ORF type:complete len:470 (-),score=125.71 TRINITY_DN1562_c0_g1_i1:1379-2788(-)
MATDSHSTAVGNNFVLKYYTMLNQEPRNLAHFYGEKSVLTHGYEDEEKQTINDTVTGPESIRQKIESLGFTNCSVSLSVVDCQDSLNESVFIFVSGSISNNGSPHQKFVQTFLLAPQTNGYYVLNDVFRYIKESAQSTLASSADHAAAVAASTGAPEIQPQATQATSAQSTKASAPAKPEEPAKAETAPEVKPQEKKAEEKKPEEKKPEAAATSQRSEKADAPAKQAQNKSDNKREKRTAPPAQPKGGKSGPKNAGNAEQVAATPSNSWANLVSGSFKSGTSSPVVIPTKPQAPANPEPAKAAAVPAKAASAPAAASQAKPPSANAGPKPGKPQLKEGFTIYVNNIPFSATEEQVKAALAHLGESKSISLRPGKGFAFVEYGSPEIAQNIAQTAQKNPVVMDGRTLVIEEKRIRTDAPSGFKGEKKPRSPSENRDRSRGNSFQGKQGKPEKPKEKKPFHKESIITSPSV